MMPVALLCGPAHVGKDTVADMICKAIPGAKKIAQADAIKDFCRDAFGLTKAQLYGKDKETKFVLRPYEDKRRAQHVPYWHPRQQVAIQQAIENLYERMQLKPKVSFSSIRTWVDLRPRVTTPRDLMQTLGTQWGRLIDPLMWAKETWRRATALLVEGAPYVVITDGRFRNEILYASYQGGTMVRIFRDVKGLKGKAAKHASETEIEKVPLGWFDATIYNEGTLAELRKLIRKHCYNDLSYFVLNAK